MRNNDDHAIVNQAILIQFGGNHSMRKRNHLMAATAIGAAIATTASCGPLVSGDSFVTQTALVTPGTPTAYGVAASTVNGVTLKGYSGAAPCDYENFVASDYNKYRPSKESLAFSGNNMSACMGGATGAAFLLRYHDGLVSLTNFLTSKGVAVIYSAPICSKPGSIWVNGSPELRSMEAGLASRFRAQGKHVAYSESAALSVCPGWQFTSVYRGTDSLPHLSALGANVYANALRAEAQNVNP